MSNYYLESRTKQRQGTEFFFITAIIFILIIIFYTTNRYYKNNFYETEAIVTKTHRAPHTKKYSIVYKYSVDGKEYEGKYFEKVHFLVPQSGKKIKILYSKDNISNSQINQISRIIKHIILILVGILLFNIIYKKMIK